MQIFRQEMRNKGFKDKRLQLIHDMTGVFMPGILTALMGVTGAGKTTLMDVLSGRKNSGHTEGDIRIGGYPRVQHTFARVSGYCEQSDIHSPQITVEESVAFSAYLRLPSQIDANTRADYAPKFSESIFLVFHRFKKTKSSNVNVMGSKGSIRELHRPAQFPRNRWDQYRTCPWKQNLP